MAPTRFNHGSESVVSHTYATPSLVSTGSTASSSSIDTELACNLPTMLLLEERDGVLERADVDVPSPVFVCAFSFLCCPEIFDDEEEWKMHCMSHFRTEAPPRKVQCPLCDFQGTYNDGRRAWEERLAHVANEHHRKGQNLSLARPDFNLFHYLWQKRIIDDAQYKELKGGNHTLSRACAPFTVTQGPDQDRRRHRLFRYSPRDWRDPRY